MDLIMTAIGRTDYRPGKDVTLALDVAASEFYVHEKQKYFLSLEHAMFSADDLINRYAELAQSYPLTSIEDGLSEDDWGGWVAMTKRLHEKMLLVGDDVFVTNRIRFDQGIRLRAANAILIKLNQIGTLTETMETIAVAEQHEYVPVISHRSGETSDAFIADLAVAVNAPYIKAGAVARGERLAKYNRLIEIEASLQ
jgi:enolase